MAIDAATLSETLEQLSDADTARRIGREVRTIRGVRGVGGAEIAQLATAAWEESAVDLDKDEDELTALFGAAFEDGLLAIALLAGVVPDAPHDVLDIGVAWLTRVDDHQTADALGWMVLGPALLACGAPLQVVLGPARALGHVAPRRAALMMGMAMTPETAQGPAAAVLRQRLGNRHIQFVEQAVSTHLTELCTLFLRDEAPPVRKALRRVLGAWARSDPDAASGFIDGVRGGVPKMLRQEVVKGARKGRRLQARSEGVTG